MNGELMRAPNITSHLVDMSGVGLRNLFDAQPLENTRARERTEEIFVEKTATPGLRRSGYNPNHSDTFDPQAVPPEAVSVQPNSAAALGHTAASVVVVPDVL